MITLERMPAADFDAFERECTRAYAADNVSAGRWREPGAPARAQQEFRRLLPDGLDTPDHFIYSLRETATLRSVGFLWFAELEADGVRTGYVYSIHVDAEHRGRGFAKAAIDLVEELGRARGLASVALHVFNHNAAAQALYRSVGYWITGFNMLKPLRRDGD